MLEITRPEFLPAPIRGRYVPLALPDNAEPGRVRDVEVLFDYDRAPNDAESATITGYATARWPNCRLFIRTRRRAA